MRQTNVGEVERDRTLVPVNHRRVWKRKTRANRFGMQLLCPLAVAVVSVANYQSRLVLVTTSQCWIWSIAHATTPTQHMAAIFESC